jgi:hypothetical protein
MNFNLCGLPAALAAIATVAALVPADANAQTLRSVNVRTLNPLEAAAVDGLAAMPQVDLNLRASAMVSVSALRNEATQTAQQVQRSNLGVSAAVYAGLPGTAKPLLPTNVVPHLHNFVKTGDSAQAWATMTAAGVPHLFVTGFGEFRADATAAWTARFQLGGSTSKEVVLRFMVPPTVVSGATEEDGPAWWRAQMRTDVLVNGFPAWSTEAHRLRADFVKNDGNGSPNKPLLVLQTFGDPLDFPTHDEDASNANDSNAGNVSQAAAARWVHLSLGRFMPGQQIELSMIVRGSAYTRPASPAFPDRKCNKVGSDYFCSRATMSVQMGNAAPTVTLMP